MSGDELDALTPQGLARAEAVGKQLAGKGVVAVYTSPAQRAQQTAAAIAKALGLGAPIAERGVPPARHRQRRGRRERHRAHEELEGRRWIRARPAASRSSDGYARASAALAELAKQHAGQTIVVVTHGEIASSLITKAAGQDLLADYFKNFPDEGSVHELDVR